MASPLCVSLCVLDCKYVCTSFYELCTSCVHGQVKQTDHERGYSGNARVIVKELEVTHKEKEDVDTTKTTASFGSADYSRTPERYG